MQLFGKSGASLIPLLKQGGPELARLSKEFDELGGGLSEDFILKADEAGDEIDKLRLGFRGLKSQMTIAILPGLSELSRKFSAVIGHIRAIVHDTNIAKYAWAGLAAVGAAAAAKVGTGWAKAMGVLPKNAGVWESILGLGKWGVVTGLATGFGLALEDLWVGIQGGESVIRDWLNETLGVEDGRVLSQLGTTIGEVGCVHRARRIAKRSSAIS